MRFFSVFALFLFSFTAQGDQPLKTLTSDELNAYMQAVKTQSICRPSLNEDGTTNDLERCCTENVDLSSRQCPGSAEKKYVAVEGGSCFGGLWGKRKELYDSNTHAPLYENKFQGKLWSCADQPVTTATQKPSEKEEEKPEIQEVVNIDSHKLPPKEDKKPGPIDVPVGGGSTSGNPLVSTTVVIPATGEPAFPEINPPLGEPSGLKLPELPHGEMSPPLVMEPAVPGVSNPPAHSAQQPVPPESPSTPCSDCLAQNPNKDSIPTVEEIESLMGNLKDLNQDPQIARLMACAKLTGIYNPEFEKPRTDGLRNRVSPEGVFPTDHWRNQASLVAIRKFTSLAKETISSEALIAQLSPEELSRARQTLEGYEKFSSEAKPESGQSFESYFYPLVNSLPSKVQNEVDRRFFESELTSKEKQNSFVKQHMGASLNPWESLSAETADRISTSDILHYYAQETRASTDVGMVRKASREEFAKYEYCNHVGPEKFEKLVSQASR